MATPLEISIACWYATPAGKNANYNTASADFEHYNATRNRLIDFGVLIKGGRNGPDYLTEKGLAWVQALTMCGYPTVSYVVNGNHVLPYTEPSSPAGIPVPVASPPALFINDGKPIPAPTPRFTISQPTLDDVAIKELTP